MTITRALGAAALFVGAAISTAAPAASAEPMEGIYTFNEPGSLSSTWQILPTCVPSKDSRFGGGRAFEASGCYLHVSSSTPAQSTRDEKLANYGGTAYLANDRWTLMLVKLQGVQCPDGSTESSTDTYIFDDATLTGTHMSARTAVCGLQPDLVKTPFTLTFVGPLPNPVVRYPLDCPTPQALCV